MQDESENLLDKISYLTKRLQRQAAMNKKQTQ